MSPILLERVLDQPGDVLLVFDDEHARARGAPAGHRVSVARRHCDSNVFCTWTPFASGDASTVGNGRFRAVTRR